MNIAVLDGLTRYSHYLDWTPLAEFGNLTVYDRTPPELVVERSVGADAVLVNGSVLDRAAIERLPGLKYIGILITGHELIDLRAAAERGAVVTNVPDYGTMSVAQMALAHILNLTQRVDELSRGIRAGRYEELLDSLLNGNPLRELSALKLGIVGFGRIGQAVAKMALSFGMEILAHDSRPMTAPDWTKFLELDDLFRESDVVSLHCPLTAANRRLVDRRRLALMKPAAILINTSRGALVDENALASALNAGRIAGAGLDVLSVEPPRPDNPLLSARNCFVTPHVASVTRAAMDRQFSIAVANLRAYIAGSPQNVLLPDAGA